MKKLLNKHHLEQGQILVIVAIMMFALIAMTALIIDGGSLMSNRRTAQAAADAGALAGAQCICTGDCPGGSPEGTAKLYATNNGAEADTAVSVSGGEVTVLATVENASFFANIFGEENLTATAEAVAICSPPSLGNSPLPVAFYAYTPALNPTDPDEEPDPTSTISKYDFQTLVNLLKTTGPEGLPLDDIYIIGENVKVCDDQTTGTELCEDVSYEGFGGDRLWIDLFPLYDGPQNIQSLIENGLDRPLGEVPIWVNAYSGNVTSAYTAIPDIEQSYEELEGMEALLVAIPLFDDICVPSQETCNFGDDNKIEGFSDSSRSYRISGFGAFLVTCMRTNSGCKFGCVEDVCPGYNEAADSDIKNSFEGYWVYDSPLNLSDGLGGSEGYPGGTLTITLIK